MEKLVNYGYNSESRGWKENRKAHLALALRQLLLDMKLTRNELIEDNNVPFFQMHEYPEPYIETDGMYGGVRIRKITALTDKQNDELIREADKIYCGIMQIDLPQKKE